LSELDGEVDFLKRDKSSLLTEYSTPFSQIFENLASPQKALIKYIIDIKSFNLLSKIDLSSIDVENSELSMLILENIKMDNFRSIEEICKSSKNDPDSDLFPCYLLTQIFSLCKELNFHLEVQNFEKIDFIEKWAKINFSKILHQKTAQDAEFPGSVYYKSVAYGLKAKQSNMSSIYNFLVEICEDMIIFQNFYKTIHSSNHGAYEG
jgi:uncharacterized protein YlaN (UPF0358 family)